MSVPHFAQGRECGRCNRPFTDAPGSLVTSITGLRCALCMLDVRETQLVECTRVMREVATELAEQVVPWVREEMGNPVSADRLQALADMLFAVRAGKGEPS